MADRYFSFNPNREDTFEEKINLDSLFERKRELNLSRLSVYQKILHRIHERIKHIARQKNNEDFCFYVVPEFMFGVPRYDVATCVSYVMEQLQDNGFVVKYTHPNLLFISWKHYIPSYQREEIRKKTGYRVNGFGNILSVDAKKETKPTLWDVGKSKSGSVSFDWNKQISHGEHEKKHVSFSEPHKTKHPKKEYRDTKSYKPTGNMIYDEKVIESIQSKLKLEDAVELKDIDF